MSFMDLAKNRFSCRAFCDKAVESEKLNAILEAGRIAPTAKNIQPVKVFVVKSQEKMEALRAATKMNYGAPITLVVAYDKNQSYKPLNYNDDHDGGDVDGGIVSTHMMMEATELGLATLWARGFNHVAIEKALELPENMCIVNLLDVGYADPERGKPSPRHEARIPMAEFAKEI